jgi:hypothetical protein
MQLRLVNMVVPGGEVMRQAKGLAAKLANKSAVPGSADGHPRAGCAAGRPAAEREQSTRSSPAPMRGRHYGVLEKRSEFRWAMSE